MVNAHYSDPGLLFKDALAVIKLNHVIAGLYIWETVFSAGFELDVLRGKRPYRWTIWIYLGTRYLGLLAFIVIILASDSGSRSCGLLVIMELAPAYASWTFASLTIVLRVIAIWNRKIFVSSLVVGAWLAGTAVNIYGLTTLEPSYNAVLDICIISDLQKSRVNIGGMIVVDILLLASMLIGLLQHAHRSSTGVWFLLYQQCIIWIALATVAEVPLVAFIALNLNDAWDGMFGGPAIATMTIGAARMYRSLYQRGCLTDCVSFEPSPASQGVFNLRYKSATHGSIHFAAVATPSSGTTTTSDAPVSLSAGHISVFMNEGTKEKAVCETA